jgi:hypothetical protein
MTPDFWHPTGVDGIRSPLPRLMSVERRQRERGEQDRRLRSSVIIGRCDLQRLWKLVQAERDRRARLASDVDGRAQPRVRLDLPQHLPGHGGGVALPEQQVAQGVALGPLEVAVGPQTTDISPRHSSTAARALATTGLSVRSTRRPSFLWVGSLCPPLRGAGVPPACRLGWARRLH